MSTFDTKLNSAICVLPWIHSYREINDKVSPCCNGSALAPDETLEDVRHKMLQGIKPSVCNRCYRSEEKSRWSPRIQETTDWLKKHGEPDIHRSDVQSIDIRFDPTCNLKCKTCGPTYSTLWKKEKNIPVTKNKFNYHSINQIDKRKLRKVYIAGGEPTYINAYLEWLEDLFSVNPKCEVIINTNLKKLPTRWKEIIKKSENICIVCSCDATESLATYVRYPIDWGEFEKNVDFAEQHANFLQFNLVASNLTIHKLYETCSWMKQYSNNINISVLQTPLIFSEKAVPISSRQNYIENLKKLQKFPVSIYYAVSFRSQINYLIKNYEENDYDQNLHTKLVDEIREQDSRRHLKLADVDPFLQSWIKA